MTTEPTTYTAELDAARAQFNSGTYTADDIARWLHAWGGAAYVAQEFGKFEQMLVKAEAAAAALKIKNTELGDHCAGLSGDVDRLTEALRHKEAENAELSARFAVAGVATLRDGNALPIATTDRGFAYADFIDRYDKKCSIQDSSLATEDCIWLGVDEERMHLTRDMARALMPLLCRFIGFGSIAAQRDEGEDAR